jgi:hypothetical protein
MYFAVNNLTHRLFFLFIELPDPFG